MNIFKGHAKRASPSADNEPSVLSEKKKKQQEIVQTVEVDPDEHHDDCPICQDPVGLISESYTLEHWRYLPCKHKFGRDCIRTYLAGRALSAEKPLCPMCRAPAYHSCGHVVLPQPAGVQPRSTTTTCDYCAFYNGSCRLLKIRPRQHKYRKLAKLAVFALMPLRAFNYRRVREACVRAGEEWDGREWHGPWKAWWDKQDRQPPLPKR